MTEYRSKAFNTPAALLKSKLLPFRAWERCSLVTCSNCNYVNELNNNYCTNCGYPMVINSDKLNLYNHRLQERQELLLKSEETIQFARNTLYIMATLCLLSVTVVLMEYRPQVLSAAILIVLSAIFIGLGRWSLIKPFTALLISFLIVVTFLAINTWAEFSNMFTTSYGLYLLLMQVVCFIFLMRGLQAAYRADIMEEEFKL